jgi:molybdopterin converting factor small subunit
LNNQVLQGLVYQIGLRPPLFKVNPSATARKRIENKTKEICGDTYQAYKELIDDLSEVKDKRKWLKRIEIASVAYDELIENKKPDIAEGDEFLHKIRTYVEKFKGAVP